MTNPRHSVSERVGRLESMPLGTSGPTGPAGPAGPTGTRGGQRFYGHGPPTTIIGSSLGDEYLDVDTGDLYQLE